MKIHANILDKAIAVAKKSDVARGKLGAVCFTNSGNIIATAYNKILYGHENHFTVHAEMALLAKLIRLRAGSRLGIDKLNILVVRYRAKDGKIAIAKPCKRCQYYLKNAGIQVFYSTNDGKIVSLRKKICRR